MKNANETDEKSRAKKKNNINYEAKQHVDDGCKWDNQYNEIEHFAKIVYSDEASIRSVNFRQCPNCWR